MCTVSWFRQPEGYTLYFNRDESRQRQPGLPPETGIKQGTAFICPRDPEGGGTWLLVNEHRITLGLLNYYEAQVNYQPEVRSSRGQLPLSCSVSKSLDEVEARLQNLDLTPFPPFHFLALDFQTQTRLLTWDGKTKQWSQPGNEDLPLSTSSFQTEAVLEARRAWYQTCIEKYSTESEALEIFHTTNEPQPDTHAVLMTRDNAKTVSVTRVDVTRFGVNMYYRARSGDSPALAPEISITLPAELKGV